MRKFDPNNLSLFNILSVLVPAVLLLSVWGWLSAKPYEYDGARGLAVDGNGVVHIQVDKTLFRFNESGEELPSVDLRALGVSDFVGDLSFNANNDLLLRQGQYKTGFLENLSIYFRVSNKRDPYLEDGEALSLCNLNAMQCRPFGETTFDYNRGFFSVVNTADGSAYITDKSRHELHRYDRNGIMTSSFNEDLKFPNDLLIDQSSLFLVDTNNKAIKKFDLSGDSLGLPVNTYNTQNADAESNAHRWPYSLEKVGDSWWLILLDNSMHYGGVYVYDENWNYVSSLERSAGDIPTSILSLENEVLVTDIEKSNVARYSKAGVLLGHVSHSALNERLAVNQEQRIFWRLCGTVFLFAMAVLIAGMFAFALVLNRKTVTKELAQQNSSEPVAELDIDEAGDLIEWVPPRNLLRSMNNVRKIQYVGLGIFVVVFFAALYYLEAYINPGAGLENVSVIAPASILFCGLLLLMGDQARVRLGTYNNRLVLHDQVSSRAVVACGKSILYDGKRIAFGALSVPSSTALQPVYENSVFVKNVYPLLAHSNVVKTHTMQMWRGQNERARIFESTLKSVFVVAVIGLLIFFGKQ